MDPRILIHTKMSGTLVKWYLIHDLRLGSHSPQPVPQRALRHLCGDLHRAVHARHRGPLPQLCVLHHPTLLHHVLHCCTPRSDRTLYGTRKSSVRKIFFLQYFPANAKYSLSFEINFYVFFSLNFLVVIIVIFTGNGLGGITFISIFVGTVV